MASARRGVVDMNESSVQDACVFVRAADSDQVGLLRIDGDCKKKQFHLQLCSLLTSLQLGVSVTTDSHVIENVRAVDASTAICVAIFARKTCIDFSQRTVLRCRPHHMRHCGVDVERLHALVVAGIYLRKEVFLAKSYAASKSFCVEVNLHNF